MLDHGLERALDRLETAIERLDRAAIHAKARVHNGNSHDDTAMQGELQALKQEYASLAGVTQSVASRLDQAVERLEESLD